MNYELAYFMSRTGTKRNVAAAADAQWGWMVGPVDMGGPIKAGMRHAVDNGAWPTSEAFRRGERVSPVLDLKRFLITVARHGPGADFIVIPDIVADGRLSWPMSRYWMRRLRRRADLKGVPLLIAVQDGMTPEMIEPYLRGRDKRIGIFVGGSTEWKMATGKAWCDLANKYGVWCHVARVNTPKRMRVVIAWGATSADGSSGTRFAVTIRPLDMARRQGDLEGYLARNAA